MPAPPTTERPGRKYLELRLRRPSSIWSFLRGVSVSGAAALVATLIVRPETGLFVLWGLLVPVLPALFLAVPGFWRNVCPMAAVNQVPRRLAVSRSLALPEWLRRHGYAFGIAWFITAIALRHTLFEVNGPAAAALVSTALGIALLGGFAFKGKSGFCGSLCPLRAVQGLYAQAPVAHVENSHCRPCVGCVSNCPDLKPGRAFADDIRDEDGRRGRYRRLFAAGLPGFTVAYFAAPGADSGLAAVGPVGLFVLASIGSFFLLESLTHARAERLAMLYGAVAFGAFYWFNVPALAGSVEQLADGSVPEWAIWEGRVLAIALGAGTLGRSALRGARSGASPSATSRGAAPVATGTSLPMLGDQHAPAPAARPAEAPQPLAGDPPVPVPDRRSRQRKMRPPEVTVMPSGDRIEVALGTTLLDVAKEQGIEVQAGCGMGLCGCDPVRVLSGWENLSQPTDDELATVERFGHPDNTRFACSARVVGDVVVSLEPLMAATGMPALSIATANGNGSSPNRPNPNGKPAKRAGGDAAKRIVAPKQVQDVTRVVILGNGIAGVTAADHIRRHHADCEIDMVTDERHPFYNRTGISKLISSRNGIHRMYLLPDSWFEERRIDSWLNTRAIAIDRRARRIVLGTGEELPYDKLILATGSRAYIPPIENFGAPGTFALRSADDAMMIRAYAQDPGRRKAVVVGGGVLGLEAADELRRLGADVTVIERADWLAPEQLDAGAGAVLRRHIEGRGVRAVLGRTVKSVMAEETVTGVQLDDGSSHEADLVLVCAGIRPNAELAADAGLEVANGVLVDDQMRTGDPDILAAGDVAEHSGRVYGVWSAAVEQAEVAAINALGAERRYGGSTMPIHLKVAGVELTSIGQIGAVPEGAQEVVVEDAGAGKYRKMLLEDGRPVAAILLGHPSDAAAVLASIRERRDVSGHLEALTQGDWSVLNETPFEQAVAAPLVRHRSNGQSAEAAVANG